ncbi:diguanylate cyclase domain-containing protein [Arsukibacterium sp.]|uniref:diguanylate cyclase domain-containing protein n=1 Tax=Arsukibacterium sp. TaxID=1977258 RepID=UPI002FD87F1C
MIKRIFIFLLGIFLAMPIWAGSALPNPLRVVLSNDTFPYMFVNEQGQLDGLLVDYWREIAELQQIEVQFYAADWPDTLQLLDQQLVHVHGGMARTEEREQRYQLADTHITIYSNIYVHRDMPHIGTLDALQPYLVGVVADSSHVDTLQRLLPHLVLRSYPTVTQMFDAALQGQLRLFAGLDRLPPRYEHYQALSRQFPLYKKMPLQRIELVFAVEETSDIFVALQQAVEALPRSVIDTLERKWLGMETEDGTLLLGLSVGNQPYMQVSQQGEAQGLLVDLWRLWSDTTGVKIAFVPDTSINSLDNLGKRRLDAHIGVPAQPHLIFKQAYPIYSISSVLYYPREQQLQHISELKGKKVALYFTAGYRQQLEQQYPDINFVSFHTLDEILKALFAGEVDGFYGSEVVVPERLKQRDLYDHFQALNSSRIRSPLYVLVHPDDDELAEKITQGFEQISPETLAAVEEYWISQAEQRYFSQATKLINLTIEQQHWLRDNEPFRVGVMTNWPPMEFLDEQGNAVGLTSDILQLLSERLGIKFQLVPYDNLDLIWQHIAERKLDMVANVTPLQDRLQFASFTEVFWTVQWAAIGLLQNEVMSRAAQLKGKRLAILSDYQLANDLPLLLPDSPLIQIKDVSDGLRLLQDQEVDYVIDSVESASRLMRQASSVNFRIQLLEDLPDYPSLVAVRNDYEPLVSILNKGLQTIGQQERQQLNQRWFNIEITQGMNSARVQQLIWQVSAVALLLISLFVIWNVFLRREVALRRAAEHKMRQMATHDDLTSLPNRSLLRERLEQALLQHSRHNEIMALVFIDLDGFKQVNDEYGHDAGDELLLRVAAVLRHCIRKSDTAARFGGDEFVVLLTSLLNADDAAIVAEKILTQLKQPIQLSVGTVTLGASMGIAVYPQDGTDAASLMRQADLLMYQAKQRGKNHYCFNQQQF